jgi:hypothetical protein
LQGFNVQPVAELIAGRGRPFLFLKWLRPARCTRRI